MQIFLPYTVNCLCEKIVSVLFGKIAAKRTKNGGMRGVAGCLLDVEFRRNSTSGGVNHTRKIGNIHTPPCFSEKSDAKTFISGSSVW